MTTPLALLTLHGMGRQGEEYDAPLRAGLRRELGAARYERIAFAAVHYQPLLEPRQEAVWREMRAAARLDWRELRRFLLFYLSDVATYQYRPAAPESAYLAVHGEIRAALARLREEHGAGEPGGPPLVAVAHSLGAAVLSDYLWDAQRGKGLYAGKKAAPWERMAGLRLLVTTGCNIPLFVAGLERIEAIDPPGPGFAWWNLYDRDDPLGWPLRPLSTGFANAYDRVVTGDVEIDVGLTPLGHSKYWQDRDVARFLAGKLAALLGAD